MRILFFTDPHNADHPPRMRKDNYMEDILNKQEQLIPVAKQGGLTIIGGDIFHKKDPSKVSFNLVHRVMEIYREYPNCHILMGNHDYMNHPDESRFNHFGMLGHLPNVKIHRDIDYVSIEDWISIKFVPYMDSIEHTKAAIKSGGLLNRMVSLCFAHAPVSPTELPFDNIPLSEVVGYNDYLFCGHFHTIQNWTGGFGNPGALSRGTLIMDGTLDRPVGALQIVIEDRTVTPLFCHVDAKRAEDVFHLDKAIVKQEHIQAVSDFVEHISGMIIPRALDKDELVEVIKGLEIDEVTKSKAIAILETV